ncbi:hypothetical protein BT93_E1539 [Corymbia citriodora subsp. variegata]|nr:hypothetical protein BT93_E1539 [Corymbia citriodora subsp. variegata]
MAALIPISSLLLLLLSSAVPAPASAFATALDPSLMGINLRKEKLSHFRFYWHDVLSGPKPTSVRVVTPPSNTSATGFGLVNIIDNPLTLLPDPSSKLVGRAQGFYTSASQEELALLMVMNFAFVTGKYNGSGITVMGRNPIFNKVREMPVISGCGLFRFARGYAQASTHTVDLKTGDAVVEYNVYVLHY